MYRDLPIPIRQLADKPPALRHRRCFGKKKEIKDFKVTIAVGITSSHSEQRS
jgi:hypothetical protein